MNYKTLWNELKKNALSNPRGKVVRSGATGNDVDNYGSWNMGDMSIDVIEDIMNGLKRLNNIPSKMLMHPETYSNFINAIGFKQLYEIGSIFGCEHHDRNWLDVNDEYEKGIVLILSKPQNDYAPSPDPAVVYIDVT